VNAGNIQVVSNRNFEVLYNDEPVMLALRVQYRRGFSVAQQVFFPIMTFVTIAMTWDETTVSR